MSNTLSGTWVSVVAAALVVGMFGCAWGIGSGIGWLLVAVMLAVFMIVIGLHIVGRPAGVLVNELNLMSLSRFQMAIWTIIVLSAYFTMAVVRIKAGTPDALKIAIDWQLWALLGISTTALVGTPLILSTKKSKEPVPNEVAKTAAMLNEPQADVDANRQGILYANPSPADARFIDIFQGDELKNTAHVDLAKVQMFFFTVITAFAYCVMLFNAFVAAKGDPAALASLPALPDGMVAILGISHAGYLTSKGIDRTKTS